MDVAKSGGRPVHGGSLDPDVSTVACPELSGQPAPKLSGFLWDDQLGKGWAMNPQLGACREVWPLQSSKKPIGSTVLAPNNNDLTMQTSSCLGENHGAAGGGIEVASFPS